MRATHRAFERQVAPWVPNGAVAFFALALAQRAAGKRDAMRDWALKGVRLMRTLREARGRATP